MIAKFKNELIALLIFVIFNILVLMYASTLTGHGDGMAVGIFLGIIDLFFLGIALIWTFYKIIKHKYYKTVGVLAIIVLGMLSLYIKQEFYPKQLGEDELIEILKKSNLDLEDTFEISDFSRGNGTYCQFDVILSEQDHQRLLEQLSNMPDAQKDDERFTLENPEGYKIIVDKYAKWLGVIGCPEVPYIDYNDNEGWLRCVRIDEKVSFVEPRLNEAQQHDEQFLGQVLDSPKIQKPWEFILTNGLQQGMFRYEIGIGKIAKGNVYLKAFELSTNHPLSAETLKKQTTIEVENTEPILKKTTNDSFTIYEGDDKWAYLVRFEVWYQPGQGKAETKMAEKVYKIKGWQR